MKPGPDGNIRHAQGSGDVVHAVLLDGQAGRKRFMSERDAGLQRRVDSAKRLGLFDPDQSHQLRTALGVFGYGQCSAAEVPQERDSQFKPEYRDTIRALFPKSHFAKLPGAGHWLHAERPREFEQAVQVFLNA